MEAPCRCHDFVAELCGNWPPDDDSGEAASLRVAKYGAWQKRYGSSNSTGMFCMLVRVWTQFASMSSYHLFEYRCSVVECSQPLSNSQKHDGACAALLRMLTS